MDREDEQGRAPYQVIADELREQIREGVFAPGEKIPSVPQLAETYGVATATVQSAIKVLKSLSLVEGRPGAGTFVTESAGRRDLAGIAAQFQMSRQELYALLLESRNSWDDSLSVEDNAERIAKATGIRVHLGPIPGWEHVRVHSERPLDSPGSDGTSLRD